MNELLIKIDSDENGRAIAEWGRTDAKLKDAILRNPEIETRPLTDKQRKKIAAIANAARVELGIEMRDFWAWIEEIKKQRRWEAKQALKTPAEPPPEKPPKPSRVPRGLVDQRDWLKADMTNDRRLWSGRGVILQCLYKHSWPGRNYIEISIQQLAKETKLHVSTVCRYLIDMEKSRYFKRRYLFNGVWEAWNPEHRYGGRGYRTRLIGLLPLAEARNAPEQGETAPKQEKETLAPAASV